MAENLDNSFGNFSIENTMEMGMGSSELLNDLLSPETSTSSPDDIQEIVKQVPEDAPVAPPKKAAKPVATTTEDEPAEKPKEDPSKALTSFLSDDDNEDDDEDTTTVEQPAKASKAKAPAAAEEEQPAEEQEVTQFGALAKDLTKLGVFTQDEDEEEINISTPEEFLERFQIEKKKGAIEVVNNFIGQFGEDYQKAFDAIFVKGVNPKEYFGTYNNITSFADLDLSQENNQVAVIKQALTDQGFDTEDIDTEVERLKNYGDLESVATKHHKVLVKKEAQKLAQMEQNAELELRQKQVIKNQYIQNVQTVLQEKLKNKEFDGIPINPKLAGELQDFLLVDKYKTATGETLTDFDRAILELKRPENHTTKVKLALLMKILEKDPTLSTIQRTGVTKKSNQLFGEVARQVTKSGTKSGSSQQQANSWFI